MKTHPGRWKCPHCEENAAPFVALAEKVANLNPTAGEIGAGMLANLVEMAQTALKDMK